MVLVCNMFLFNIRFAHFCSLTALERYVPKKNLIHKWSIIMHLFQKCSRPSGEIHQRSSKSLISDSDLNTTLNINKGPLCIPFRSFQHFTDFTFKWLYLEPYSEILQPLSPRSHHPHQTPSLCPFRADFVILQIQVRQRRVLLEAFGQGLTGEIWTSSPALESIKL